MSKFAQRGAKTAALLCSTAFSGSTCEAYPPEEVTGIFNKSGFSLDMIIGLDFTADTYEEDLAATITACRDQDIDILVIYDYDRVCVDAVSQAKAIDWTSRGLYFNTCTFRIN
jgi:hypothetical protein